MLFWIGIFTDSTLHLRDIKIIEAFATKCDLLSYFSVSLWGGSGEWQRKKYFNKQIIKIISNSEKSYEENSGKEIGVGWRFFLRGKQSCDLREVTIGWWYKICQGHIWRKESRQKPWDRMELAMILILTWDLDYDLH